MFKEKNSAACSTPATLCRAVSHTRSLCAINSFLLPVLTVPPVRQTPQTIHRSQGDEGIRVQEGTLWNTVKQPPFTNTCYRKSGPFSILLPTIPYQVVQHPWTVDPHLWDFGSAAPSDVKRHYTCLVFMTVEPFIYVPVFGFLCLRYEQYSLLVLPFPNDTSIDWHLMLHSPRRTDEMSEAVKGRDIFISNSSRDIGNGWRIHQLSQTAGFSWCSRDFYYSLIDSVQ